MKTTKTAQAAKNKLKYTAPPTEGVLYLRLGVKKVAVPTAVRLLTDGKKVFASIPALIGVFEIDGKKLTPLPDTADFTDVVKSLRPAKTVGRKRLTPNRAVVDEALLAAIKNIPNGYKLAYKNNEPVLVKTRVRTKKAA